MTVKYTPEHEWIQLEDHEYAVVGITLHAQDALGDVVFVDLPEVGRTYAKGEQAGVVESVKAAADVYMPIAGEVTEVNEELRGNPSLAMPAVELTLLDAQARPVVRRALLPADFRAPGVLSANATHATLLPLALSLPEATVLPPVAGYSVVTFYP